MKSMSPRDLLWLTREMPCKTIEIDGKPYLRRYFAGTFEDGSDLWLHQFLSADGDRHLHCHPFSARAAVICGGYVEHLKRFDVVEVISRNPALELRGLAVPVIIRKAKNGEAPPVSHALRPITKDTWHRIAHVERDTWTLMIVQPDREPYWFFDNGDSFRAEASSPRDWWKSYGPRKSPA